MSLAFEMMMFARQRHLGQVRKYTGNPYHDHLAEVAGIVASLSDFQYNAHIMIAVAFGHDLIEDTQTTFAELDDKFGWDVANGIFLLSDLEQGTRAKRKELSRARLEQSPDWVQTIKCADLISNTSSIVQHDPDFAAVYLNEKRMLLDVMTKADPRLLALARHQAEAA